MKRLQKTPAAMQLPSKESLLKEIKWLEEASEHAKERALEGFERRGV